MEKTCEFCKAPRPVVYCQADAAFLCLSCDAKVHSANALSGRHSRDLLCDSCRENSAYVRCLDRSMLLCRWCESRLHVAVSFDKKLMLKSFTGSPSANHFAALLGFNDNEEAQFSTHCDLFGSDSCLSNDHGCLKIKSLGFPQPEMGSSSQKCKSSVSPSSMVSEFQDLSIASSISISNDISTFKYSSHPSKSSYSASFSTESSGSDCLDSGHSRNLTEVEGGENSRRILRERKKARLNRKQNQLAPCKRIKDRFVNDEGYQSDTVNLAKRLIKGEVLIRSINNEHNLNN